jgi:hypothetical protein
MKDILKIIESETKGRCFGSQKYSIDIERNSTLEYTDEKEIIIEQSGETERQTKYINLSNIIKQVSLEEPLFKYFLDGSRRVYKIDDIAYDQKVYPIIAGQIGVGCCKRENRQIKKLEFKRENVIVLPIDANPDNTHHTEYFENIRIKINEYSQNKKIKFNIDKILYYIPKKDQDSKDLAVIKVQDRMIELEKDLVSELVKNNFLNKEAYLAKDGSLEYKEYNSSISNKYSYTTIRNNYAAVVGISKSFNPSLARKKDHTSMAKDIAELPNYHRTPAFMYESEHTGHEKFAVWYVRLRSANHCQSPFDGVVKVEKILMKDSEQENGLNTNEINMISANIINERNPVCYGNDNRWANHIYPIYLTETFVKSQYISNTFFLNIF